jgi:outer membrane biosynthesis protein TonB
VHQPWKERDPEPPRQEPPAKRESRRRPAKEPRQPKAKKTKPKKTKPEKTRRPRAEKTRQPKPAREPGRAKYILASTLGALLAGGAWYFLVKAAISFGHAAMNSGQMPAWGFTAAATAGATGCMLLVFMLITRAYAAVRPVSEE